jgi:hypothetical protein
LDPVRDDPRLSPAPRRVFHRPPAKGKGQKRSILRDSGAVANVDPLRRF